MSALIRHSLAVRGDDLYESPVEAVHALLDHCWPPIVGPVWEPACGPGVITKELRNRGIEVVASDLVNYGDRQCPDSQSNIDFLMEQRAPDSVKCIVTNPPYKLAAQFVRHAVALKVPRIVMLLRLSFLESMDRCDVLEESGLFRVNVFRNRLPMMHRDGFDGPKNSSAVSYAWFDWHPLEHKGPASVTRISWIKLNNKKQGDLFQFA